MKRFNIWFVWAIFAAFLTDCKQRTNLSTTKKLWEDNMACDSFPDKLDELKAKYGSKVSAEGWSDQNSERAKSAVKDAWLALSRLPAPYLETVFDTATMEIRPSNSCLFSGGGGTIMDDEELEVGGGLFANIAGNRRQQKTTEKSESVYRPGVTSWSLDFKPKLVCTTESNGNFNATAHEIGHGIRYLLFNTMPGSQDAYENGLVNTTADSIRGYSRSSISELLADIFDSYYCSEDSRLKMLQSAPNSLKFATRYLSTPLNVPEGGGIVARIKDHPELITGAPATTVKVASDNSPLKNVRVVVVGRDDPRRSGVGAYFYLKLEGPADELALVSDVTYFVHSDFGTRSGDPGKNFATEEMSTYAKNWTTGKATATYRAGDGFEKTDLSGAKITVTTAN